MKSKLVAAMVLMVGTTVFPSLETLAVAQVDPNAVAAVEQYASALESFDNLACKYELYICLYPDLVKKLPPGRFGLYPIRRFGEFDYELDKRGTGYLSKGGKFERYDYEKVGAKNASAVHHLVAYDGDRIFTYTPHAKSGLKYSPDDPSKNHLYTNGVVGNQLGKRANNGPMVDLVELLRKSTQLRIVSETDDEISISATTPGFREEVQVDLFTNATFLKKHGYMPAKWEVGRSDWGTRFQAVENSDFFETRGVWMPKFGYLHTFGTDKKNGKFAEKRTGTAATVLDPNSVKVNSPLPSDFFSLPMPKDGVILDEVTGELFDSREGRVKKSIQQTAGNVSKSSFLMWYACGIAALIFVVGIGLFVARFRSKHR